MLWHAALWLAVAPFVAMTVALTRASATTPYPPLETAFAISSVGAFVLVAATVIASVLWTVAGGGAGFMAYARNVALATVAGLVLGFIGGFGAGYYVASAGAPVANRWAAHVVCLASVGALLWFCLHATWRFRHR